MQSSAVPVRLKPVLASLALFLPLFSLANLANGTTYVWTPRLYNYSVNGQTLLTRNPGAAAAGQAAGNCNGYGVSGCVGGYTGESYNNGAWQWTGIESYTQTILNPPNPPDVRVVSTTIGNYISYYCPTGFTPYDNVNNPGLCAGPDKPEPVPAPPPNCGCTGAAPPSAPSPGGSPPYPVSSGDGPSPSLLALTEN